MCGFRSHHTKVKDFWMWPGRGHSMQHGSDRSGELVGDERIRKMKAQFLQRRFLQDEVTHERSTRQWAGLLFFLIALLLCRVPAIAQQQGPHTMEELHRLHQDPKAYIAMLEDPERDAYQKPHEVITALDLKDGDVVADICAGSARRRKRRRKRGSRASRRS